MNVVRKLPRFARVLRCSFPAARIHPRRYRKVSPSSSSIHLRFARHTPMLSQRYALPWLQLPLSVGWAIPPPELGRRKRTELAFIFLRAIERITYRVPVPLLLENEREWARKRGRGWWSNGKERWRQREIEEWQGGVQRGERVEAAEDGGLYVRMCVCRRGGKGRKGRDKVRPGVYGGREVSMREEVIGKARKRGGGGGCVLFFSTKLARDAWHGRRDARIREKSDGPLIIPVTIDARSRVTGFMVGERRTKPVRKQARVSTLLRRRIDARPPFWATSREKTVQMVELGRTWSDRRMHGGFLTEGDEKGGRGNHGMVAMRLNILEFVLFLFCITSI